MMALYKQVASMPNTLRVPIRIWIRSFNGDPLYCGERRWFAGYHLELGGQKWMDFVQLETYEQALAVAKDLQSHQWFPDMTRYSRNWDSPCFQDEIAPLTPEQITRFNTRVTTWADAQRALWNLQPTCPTPGCTAGGAETGRICSKLPHTSMPPSEALSLDFSQDAVTDTNDLTKARRSLCDGPRKELSWMGTLGKPPADYKNKETL